MLGDVCDASTSSDDNRECPGEAVENGEGGQEWMDLELSGDEDKEEREEAVRKSSDSKGMS